MFMPFQKQVLRAPSMGKLLHLQKQLLVLMQAGRNGWVLEVQGERHAKTPLRSTAERHFCLSAPKINQERYGCECQGVTII